MALIGTISGSNGTSKTAISGTLVIANSPGAGFPQIPSDAVMYASGIGVVTGDLVSSGTLKSMFSAGDEGGEVFLAKPVTNSTLALGVTIDVNQNRLRVFETGGTNRGGYWDVSALGAGVSTNLAAASASPGGSDTYVQFNDGGATFGGDAGLTYNKNTDSLTIAGNLTGTNALITNDLTVSRDARASKYTVGTGAYITSSDGLSMMIAASSMELNPEVTLSVTPGQNVDVIFPFNNGSTFSIKYEDAGPVYYNALTLAPGVGEAPVLTLGSADFGDSSKLAVRGSVFASTVVTASLGLSGSLTRLIDGRSYIAAGANITVTSESNGQVTIASVGGSTAPGGSDTYVQFNDGGATFGGDAGLTYNKTTDTLTGVTGSFFSVTARTLLGSAGNPNLTLDLTGGKVTVAGDLEVDGNDILASDGLTNITLTSNTLTTFAGDVKVGGNDIQASDGATAISLEAATGNVTLPGDLAVNGGDITTSASTFNLVNSTATTVNIAGGATSAVNVGNASGTTTMSGFVTCSSDLAVNGSNISTTSATVNMFTGARSLTFNLGSTSDVSTITIGRSGNASSTNIATGNNTAGGVTKTVNIGTNTGPSATANINIGSAGALGRTTLNQDVALTTGNLIGAPGAGANVLTLVSSGNLIAKLDTDNNSPGHRFEVWDYLNAAKFAVGENGNAEIAGALLVTGSSLSTLTTTTFDLLNTALTGTLNVSSLANSINVGGSLTTSSFTGEIGVAGKTNLACVVERLVNSNGGTGTVSFNLTSQGIFYVNGPTGNITANFVSVPVTNNRVITPTIIVSQSATPRIISAVQIDTAAQTINWANNVVPTGNAGKQDVFGFSLIRSGSAWKVLGQMSTYG